MIPDSAAYVDHSMSLPYTLAVLALNPDAGRQVAPPPNLRTLANQIALASVHPKPTSSKAEQHWDVPISLDWPVEGAAAESASWWQERLLDHGLQSESCLVITDCQRWARAAREAGLSIAWLGTASASGGIGWRLHAEDLECLIEDLLALERQLDLDPAFLQQPYPREYLEGILLYNREDYYEAHEAWEIRWHAVKAEGKEGDFFKGLIQIAVSTLHWRRGNGRGAAALAHSGIRLLTPYQPSHLDLNLTVWLDQVRHYFEPLFQAFAAHSEGPFPPAPKAPAPKLELQ
ncbi:MAG: DUF309 domain-containing protein [Planctomycetota bacterium]|nr:MAG: DUF309 domain-containing protein [Planctomycetota bacterium]